MLVNQPPRIGMLAQRPVPGMLAQPYRSPPAPPPEQEQSLGVNITQPQQGGLGNQVPTGSQPGHLGSISSPRQPAVPPPTYTPQVQPSFTPMKTGVALGGYPAASNTQAISGLTSPGWQNQMPSIGGPTPYTGGIRPSGSVSGPAMIAPQSRHNAPIGTPGNGVVPGPAGAAASPGTTPVNMNQYGQSPNISTLLRTLVGNTTTPGV